MVKDMPAMQQTRGWSLDWEDPLEEDVATHSSLLAWRIPWTEEPGRLQSTGLQRVGHDWVTDTFTSLCLIFSFRSSACFCYTVIWALLSALPIHRLIPHGDLWTQFPFSRWGNWGLERFDILPQIWQMCARVTRYSALQLLEHITDAQLLGLLASLSPLITGYTHVLLGFLTCDPQRLSLYILFISVTPCLNDSSTY